MIGSREEKPLLIRQFLSKLLSTPERLVLPNQLSAAPLFHQLAPCGFCEITNRYERADLFVPSSRHEDISHPDAGDHGAASPQLGRCLRA
jgi:hypothetical protein